MEFLVQFELEIPDDIALSEVTARETAEAATAERWGAGPNTSR